MVDCINELEKQQNDKNSKFFQKLNLKVGVGTLGYSQGGAASLDTAARLGDRCAACITQHAQPSMMANTIKCPVFLHSGDQDSLTGIMKPMIWAAVRTPKVFAIMRGAHHLTPVPPSPWDPWSLAWLMLYQKGDSTAGEYIWGSAATVGSLRSLQLSGQMSEVLFDPTAPWSAPYTQYGVRSISEQGTYTVLPTQTQQQDSSLAAAAAGGNIGSAPQPSSSMFGYPSGGSSMFGFPGLSSGASGGSRSPFSFLQGLLGRYSSAPPAPSAGMSNTLSNTAGSLSNVVNVPVMEESSLEVDAVRETTQNTFDGTLQQDVIIQEKQVQYAWNPIRRVNPQVESPIQKNSVSMADVGRPTIDALNNIQEQQEIKKKVHDKQVKDLSDTLGGPYCKSSTDCCSPGECVLTVGTITSTNMCSLPAGGLGKLASDPTCRTNSVVSNQGMQKQTYVPAQNSNQMSNGNKFVLIPKPAAAASGGSPQQLNQYQDISRISQPTHSKANLKLGPSLSLVSCDDAVMTLRVGDAAVGSTVVVLGSIYAPKFRQVDQLILLSNSECPVIDVNIKVPKQHLSKQFLKTKVIRMEGGDTFVSFDNSDGDACSDYIYQAVDVQPSICAAGPPLDLR